VKVVDIDQYRGAKLRRAAKALLLLVLLLAVACALAGFLAGLLCASFYWTRSMFGI